VAVFVDSYVSTAGSFLACVVIFIAAAVSWGVWHRLDIGFTRLYLSGVVLAGAAGFWAAWRMAQHYDQDILNWRFARQRRAQVLEKLDWE
jgi:hypothetical protein